MFKAYSLHNEEESVLLRELMDEGGKEIAEDIWASNFVKKWSVSGYREIG